MKKLVCIILSVLFFMNIVGCATMQYPQTPTGKATFFAGSFHRLVNEYEIEAAWATQESHKQILSSRRTALVTAYIPIRIMTDAVLTGQPISTAMVDAANIGLMEVKKYLYTQQAIAPTKNTVRVKMVEANILASYDSQSISSGLLVLIELIQAMLPLWMQLQEQSGMTDEELAVRFGIESTWLIGFDPNALTVLQ
jgi:hypothetical protein